MFDRYLPTAVYEVLPRLYAVAAFAVALLPLSPLRWVAVGALLLASGVTLSRRRRYRAAYLRRPPAPGLLRAAGQEAGPPSAHRSRRGILCGS
jgi:hypothetical protein